MLWAISQTSWMWMGAVILQANLVVVVLSAAQPCEAKPKHLRHVGPHALGRVVSLDPQCIRMRNFQNSLNQDRRHAADDCEGRHNQCRWARGCSSSLPQPNAQGALRDASKGLLLLAAIGWGKRSLSTTMPERAM
jgi:hypothetical protein